MVLRIKIGILTLVFLIIFGILWHFMDKTDPITYNLITIEMLQLWTLAFLYITVSEFEKAIYKFLEEIQKEILNKKLS